MIRIPDDFILVEANLTLQCKKTCPYCEYSDENFRKWEYSETPLYMPGEIWVQGLNKIYFPKDLPLTITGGEPLTHPDAIEILNGIKPEVKLILETSMSPLELPDFEKKVHKFKRGDKDVIKISYHPNIHPINNFVKDMFSLEIAGFNAITSILTNPECHQETKIMIETLRDNHLPFELRDYLGMYEDKPCGSYSYNAGIDNKQKPVLCKPKQLLIRNDGVFYPCHYKMMYKLNKSGDFWDGIEFGSKKCPLFGFCSPTDVESKTTGSGVSCPVEITEMFIPDLPVSTSNG